MAQPTWETAGAATAKKSVPDGLWMPCDGCSETLFRKALEGNLWVCPRCDHHHRISGRQRVEQLVDPGSFEPMNAKMAPMDPLKFRDLKAYTDRIRDAQRATGENDGVQTGTGFIKGRKVALGCMDFTFLAGSMGSVIGEKLTRIIEHATDHDLFVARQLGHEIVPEPPRHEPAAYRTAHPVSRN